MDKEYVVEIAAAVAGRVQEFITDSNKKKLLDLQSGGAVGQTAARVGETVFSASFATALQEIGQDYIVKAIEKKTGLVLEGGLNEESLARAIGKRAGVVLRSLHDAAIIKEDLMAVAAAQIEARMGWAFDEAVRTADALIRQLARKAAREIEARVTGLVLRDLLDIDQTKRDVVAWVSLMIEQKTGAKIRDITNYETTKADLVDWAEPEIRRRLKISGTGGGGLKMTKKAIRNRLAQRRFVAVHGNVVDYEPVG